MLDTKVQHADRFTTTLTQAELDSPHGRGAVAAKKQSMTATTHRKLLQAERIIEGVARGRFPEL
jgi:hypothetical protein